MQKFQQIKEEVKALFQGAKGSHDWEHTERVAALAEQLAKKENADREVVAYAVLLHDIGRAEEDQSEGRICHAKRGAELAEVILARHSLDVSKIHRIVECIRTHRFRDDLVPESLEAKVVFDADKLDAIGAVGIGRAFLFSGEIGAKLHNEVGIQVENTLSYSTDDTAYREYVVKLRKVSSRILTTAGKRLANGRHQFMVQFFERLSLEVSGEI